MWGKKYSIFLRVIVEVADGNGNSQVKYKYIKIALKCTYAFNNMCFTLHRALHTLVNKYLETKRHGNMTKKTSVPECSSCSTLPGSVLVP